MFTGTDFKAMALIVIGNVFIVVLAVRAFGSWMKQQWGELIATVVGAILVAGFVYFPDQAIGLLQNLWKTFIK